MRHGMSSQINDSRVSRKIVIPECIERLLREVETILRAGARCFNNAEKSRGASECRHIAWIQLIARYWPSFKQTVG
jgi:hypothetical protein